MRNREDILEFLNLLEANISVRNLYFLRNVRNREGILEFLNFRGATINDRNPFFAKYAKSREYFGIFESS